MNSVSSCCYSPPDPFSMVQSNWNYESAQIAKTASAGEQSTNIVIQTADGDKFTLSSETRFDSSSITYEQLYLTSARYSKSRSQIISANANSKLQWTVEGTLDEQEKKGIKAVLMNLFKMVKDFVNGKAETEEANSFADLTTISGVEAEFDFNASTTIISQSYANHVAQTPAAEKPIMQKVETANLPAVSEGVDKLIHRMIRFAKESGVEPSKILKRFNRHLSRLSRKMKFADERPERLHKMRLRKEILENFADKLRTLSAQKQNEIKNTENTGVQEPASLSGPAIVETTASVSETILNVAIQNFHFEIQYSVADDN